MDVICSHSAFCGRVVKDHLTFDGIAHVNWLAISVHWQLYVIALDFGFYFVDETVASGGGYPVGVKLVRLDTRLCSAILQGLAQLVD